RTRDPRRGDSLVLTRLGDPQLGDRAALVVAIVELAGREGSGAEQHLTIRGSNLKSQVRWDAEGRIGIDPGPLPVVDEHLARREVHGLPPRKRDLTVSAGVARSARGLGHEQDD